MDATGKISALVDVLIRDARAKESLAKTPANLLKMQSAAPENQSESPDDPTYTTQTQSSKDWLEG
jgi:hypothetical protein